MRKPTKRELQEAIDGFIHSLDDLMKMHKMDRSRGQMIAALIGALSAVNRGKGKWQEMKAEFFEGRWHGIHEYN